MKFTSEDDNPLPNLVELRTKIAAKEADQEKHEVLVELRVHPCEIEETIGTIAIEVTEATLSVQFAGLEVVPKSKLGNPVLPVKERREIQREQTVTRSADHEVAGNIGARGRASIANVGGSTEASRQSTTKSGKTVIEKQTLTEVSEFLRFRAVGNDNWQICEPEGAALNGTYINYDPLCEVTAISGKNHVGVEAELIVKQKHLRTKLTRIMQRFDDCAARDSVFG